MLNVRMGCGTQRTVCCRSTWDPAPERVRGLTLRYCHYFPCLSVSTLQSKPFEYFSIPTVAFRVRHIETCLSVMGAYLINALRRTGMYVIK